MIRLFLNAILGFALFLPISTQVLKAQTIQEVVQVCIDFTLNQDTRWFDERWPGAGIGQMGDDRVSRFIEFESGAIEVIEAHYLRLDQGELVTISSDCGVFVHPEAVDIEAIITSSKHSLEEKVGQLSPTKNPVPDALLDVSNCFESRDFRFLIQRVNSNDVGDALWAWVRHMPDFGEGCIP